MSSTSWPSDRRTFVSLGLQSVVNAFVYSTYIARLPDIRNEAGLSIAAMGVVMTVGNLSGFAAMLPSACPGSTASERSAAARWRRRSWPPDSTCRSICSCSP